jgi:hypothetical protein
MTPISILSNGKETVPLAGGVTPSGDTQNGNSHPANGHPVDEKTKLERRHQPFSGQELFNSLKFFESVEELQDIAVGLAFAEEEEEDIVDELVRLHELRTNDLKDQYEAQDLCQRARIEITRGKISRETGALNEAFRKTATLEAEDKRLKGQGQSVSNEINLSLQQLKQERLANEKDFFEKEIVRLQDKQWQQEAAENVSEEFALAKKIYELKQQQYELNRPEFERVAEDAESEKKGVEAQLHEIRARLQRFQRLGVSRTTAGFLVHAGYASFAAVGALIAGFFNKRQAGVDFLSRIIAGVQSMIGLSEGGWAIWPPLFNLVLLIAFGIFVVTLITFVMNRLISKLDVNWMRRPARERQGDEKRGFVDLLKNFTTWVGSFFQREQDKQQSSRNRSNKDDGASLDRKAFVQLLAHMPFIIGAALVFFFFAALSLGANGQTGAAFGPLEISSTYIGVIFLTLTTSSAILYVTNVIEPRWQRKQTPPQFAPSEDEGSTASDQVGTPLPTNDERYGFIEILKLNWEFVVLVIALVFSLVMTSFLPMGDPYNEWALGSVAIFMSLASLGLAYGLVQRGLFKDFDVLERKRQDYRKQADSCNQLPRIEGVFENFDSKEISERFRDSRLTQRKIDDLRVLYQLNQIFGRDFSDDAHLEEFLAQFISSEISLKGMKRPTGTIDPLDGRFPVSEEKLEAFYAQKERLTQVGTQIAANREELEKMRSHAEKLNADLDRLQEQLLDQELGIIELKREFSDRRQQLEINHKKEILLLKSAYRIGNAAYRLIRPVPEGHGAAK